MASYLPLTDAGLLAWSANFKSQLEGFDDPTTVGITSLQVDAYSALQEAFAAKLTLATDPATRGSARILAKNNAKDLLVDESRLLAMAITNHPGVTDQVRFDLGLTVRDKEPTPVPPPSSWPDIDFVSILGKVVTVRLHDASIPGRRKPSGVSGASVFSYVGENAPTDPAAWTFNGNTTRTTFAVDFPDTVPAGAKVWITAFWFNRRMESGPGAPPVSTNLQYGGPIAQAA